jgi:dephospho-CoA kinase
MSPSLLRVALTGGIATGKSYCLSRFAQLGLPVIDADVVARRVVEAGSPALQAVVDRFGAGVLQADGTLNRHALAGVVFADRRARADLEAILHPRVYAVIQQWFASLPARELPDAQRPPRDVAIADIPLLYETDRQGDFDRVVVAACRTDQQLERLRQRGYTPGEGAARLAAQLPIEEKRQRADYVIDTSGTSRETDKQTVDVYEKLVNS